MHDTRCGARAASAPTFSVIVPCYRAAATLAVALDSVLRQTDRDFEVIVVEDGCPESSGAAAVAEFWPEPRLRLLRQANAGPGAARNAGAAAARGRLLAFLDSDDSWAPEFLARHRAAFDADPALGVSFARVRFCDAALRWGGRLSGITGPVGLADALGDNPSCTSSNLVVRRAAFRAAGGFDPALRHAEDQDLVIRLLAAGYWQVAGLDAALVDYRTSVGGLSADLDRMQAGWRAMLEAARAVAPDAVRRAEPQATARFHRYLARRALRTGHPPRRAFALLLAALRASPLALLRHQPRRSALTAAGVLAALLLPSRRLRARLAL